MDPELAIDQDDPELDPVEPRTGELFAERYAILRIVGVGGMGKVFEAHDTRIGRTVAIKLMRGCARDRPSLVQRFHREYRAMAKIRNPGVPRVFDAGCDAGRAYFTMEFVRGRPLLTSVGEPREPRQIRALVTEVARILIDLHAVGIVHRDIKPSNILVDDDNRPHLIDFGACSLAEATSDITLVPPGGTIHTAPGTWLGTLGYIDPAMLEGAGCTARSDIYSLMATLSWMFTHQHPSPEAHTSTPRTHIAAVDALLLRGMARNPDERPATAADLVAELIHAERCLSRSPGMSGRHPRTVEATRMLSPATILALAIAGGILGGALPRVASGDPPSRDTIVAVAPPLRPPDLLAPAVEPRAPQSIPPPYSTEDPPGLPASADMAPQAAPAPAVEPPASPKVSQSVNWRNADRLVREICRLAPGSPDTAKVCLDFDFGTDGKSTFRVSGAPAGLRFIDARGDLCVAMVAKEHVKLPSRQRLPTKIRHCFTVKR